MNKHKFLEVLLNDRLLTVDKNQGGIGSPKRYYYLRSNETNKNRLIEIEWNESLGNGFDIIGGNYGQK